MKIEINYDLLDKIKESKTGFSLNRTTKPVILKTLIASSIYTVLNITDPRPIDKLIHAIPVFVVLYALPVTIANIIMKNRFKDLSIKQLRILSKLLSDVNISTSYELLLDSNNYKTEYEFKLSEAKIPYIKQDKYINVPVYSDGDIREVSLVQEHIIGSNKYSLSYGSPKKVLKPAFTPI